MSAAAGAQSAAGPRWRDVLAVWRRNALVWRRLWGPALVLHFGEPLLYLVGLGYGLGVFIREMAAMPYLTFLASGIVVSSAMTTASLEGMYSVFTRMTTQRTYDAILATPVEVPALVAGEVLWCASKALLSSTAILLVASALGAVAGPRAVLVLPVAFLTGLTFAAPAILIAALARNYDFFNYYFVLAVTPMYLLCGVFFPIDSLPAGVQAAVQVLPLTHAVALARPLVAGTPSMDVAMHLGVLGGYAVIGYALARRRVTRRLST